jgi:tetratricopeptide (TPR) repeat protein
VTAGTMVTVALIGGLAATLWQSRIAQKRFDQTRALARYLMFDLTQAVGALPGATPIRADIVKHSLDYLDALSAEKIGDPSLQVELGEGYARLGTLIGHPTQDNLGELAKAGETYRKAIAILEPMGREPSNKRANLALAKARKDLGEILGFESESGEGVRLIEDSTRDFARLAERWPEDFDVRLQASITFEILALALSRPEGYIINRALDRSLPALREARDHAEAATRIRPGNAVAIDQLAITLKVSSDFTELSDHLAAAALCRETMAALDRLSAEDRRDPNARAKRSSGLLNCGNNLRYSGDFVGARRLLEEARDLRDDGWKEDPQNVLALRMRLDPYTYLLTVSSNSDRLRLHQILEGIFDAVEVHYPSSDAPEFDRAVLRAAAADLNFELGRRDEAIRLAGLAFPVLKRIALAPRALAVMQATAAKALLDSKVPGFADPKLALALAERANTRPDSTESVAMVTPADVLAYPAVLARAQWENGNPEGAIHAQERAVALLANAAPVLLAEARKTLERYRGQKS